MNRDQQQRGPETDNDTSSHEERRPDYGKLRNEELYNLLCSRAPDKPFLPVSNYSRQTVMAMLRITEGEK